MQSKDLIEKTAQKASSVSPAHFRSALRRARAIIAELPSDALSPSSSSPRRRTGRSGDTSSPVPLPTADAPSPFQTPRKRFKFSSGVDISGLVKHSPSKGSPLKQSVTPTPHRSARASARLADVEGDLGAHDEEEQDEQAPLTPTKSRFLAAPPSSRRKRDNVSAFLALRPGPAGSGDALAELSKKRDAPTADAYDFERSLRPKRVRTEQEQRARKMRSKRDWTFHEAVWAGPAVQRRNEEALLQLGLIPGRG